MRYTISTFLAASLAALFMTTAYAGGYGYGGYGHSGYGYGSYDDDYYNGYRYKRKKKVYKKKYIKKRKPVRKFEKPPVPAKFEEKEAAPKKELARKSVPVEEKPEEAVSESVSEQGGLLTDAKDMTLYIFDKDKIGISNCYSDCATSWPPYLVGKGAKAKENFSIVLRKDGTQQWAYKGQPLYYWAGDQKPGDKTGDGVGGVWHIVNVAG